jgi:hypothetical protein
MNSILLQLAAMAMLLQTTSATPIKIGTQAGALTDREVAVILALPGVSNPWLFHAWQGQLVTTVVEIHLRPTTVTSTIRRGILMAASRSPMFKEPGWSLGREEQRTYAQVLIEGVSMDQVSSPLDVNRPFETRGAFTDDELVEIVRFIRSNPLAQTSNLGGQPAVVRGNRLPIRSVARSSANNVVVELYVDDGQSELVTLQREGSMWVAISTRRRIA